jgi:outer membrane protein assembly factor BamB
VCAALHGAARLFVGSHDGAVYCLESATGRVLWKFQTGAQVQSDQVLSADGSTLFIGSDDFVV